MLLSSLPDNVILVFPQHFCTVMVPVFISIYDSDDVLCVLNMLQIWVKMKDLIDISAHYFICR